MQHLMWRLRTSGRDREHLTTRRDCHVRSRAPSSSRTIIFVGEDLTNNSYNTICFFGSFARRLWTPSHLPGRSSRAWSGALHAAGARGHLDVAHNHTAESKLTSGRRWLDGAVQTNQVRRWLARHIDRGVGLRCGSPATGNRRMGASPLQKATCVTRYGYYLTDIFTG